MPQLPLDLLYGSGDVLILRAITAEAMHGYAISRFVHERSNGILGIEGAALYQALHRLERKGWVASTWGVSENNRRARFYRITSAGKRQLQNETATWRLMVEGMSRVLELAPVRLPDALA
jgi:PadR family transcriptional regulator, regulatory protein PadR